MFPYTLNNKRYHSVDYHYKQRYHSKVAKICVDAGYSCINRDGIKGVDGCYFCGGIAVKGYPTTEDLMEQVKHHQAINQRKWPGCKSILYFQSFTNTYASLALNIQNYSIIEQLDDAVGLNIATRPDCLSTSTLNYLDSLCTKYDVTIELGLQTIHDHTRTLLNVGYTWQDFLSCVARISQTRCQIVVHLINGLPTETKQMMVESVQSIAHLPIHGIKLHMLHISENTRLAQWYHQQPFPLLTQEEYTEIVIEQLRVLPAEIVIHRLTGDPIKAELIAPQWVLNKTHILNTIDKKMAERQVEQGDATLCNT
jgi:uncharacterized protein